MNLFNRKTLKRHIKSDPIPSDHLAALKAWAELISSGRIERLKETALHGQFASKIVEGVLGYHGPAGGADYNVSTEQNILRGSVDLALGRFGGKTPDIVAPFELKGADTRDLDAIMPGRNKSPVQQAWEYAMNARGVKWVLVSNMIELRFYGFGEGTSAYEIFRLDQLTDPEEYARFMLLLSAENLLSGRTDDVLKNVNAGAKPRQSPERKCTTWLELAGLILRQLVGFRFVHRPARRSAPTEQRSCAWLWSNRVAVFGFRVCLIGGCA